MTSGMLTAILVAVFLLQAIIGISIKLHTKKRMKEMDGLGGLYQRKQQNGKPIAHNDSPKDK